MGWIRTPLAPWLLVVAVLAVGLVLLTAIGPPDPAPTVRNKVEELRHRRSERALVVVVGDSLIKAAFELESLHVDLAAKGMDLLTLSDRSLNFDKVEDLMNEVIERKPALIVLQMEPLFRLTPRLLEEHSKLRLFLDWRRRAGNILAGLFRRAWRDLAGVQKATVVPEPRSRLYAKQRWSWRTTELGRVPFFLARAKAAGVKVVIIEVAVSETAERFAPDGRLAAQRQAINAALPEDEPLLLFPRGPDDEYSDFRHLNLAGKKRFETWFSAVVLERLGS